MSQSFTSRKRIRKNFGKISSVVDMPNLIEVQKSSYEQFLQVDIKAKDRTDTGLQSVFKSVFPIKDFSGHGELEFVKYEFDEPKYDVEECLQRDLTYSAPLKATLRLVVWDIDDDTKARSIRDIKEQDVYMGDIPMMTESGTFIINGTERVVVSQMHRSPGVFFDHDGGKTHSSGKYLFSSRVIPYRGSWLDFVFDAKDIVHVRIDMRRKLPVTTLLYALDSAETEVARKDAEAKGKTLEQSEIKGMSQEEVLSYFYDKISYIKTKTDWKTAFDVVAIKGTKLSHDLKDANTGKVVCEAGTKMTSRVCDKLVKEGLTDILVSEDELVGLFSSEDLVNMETGEIFLEAGEEITQEKIDALAKNKITEISVLNIDNVNVGPYIRNTLVADKNANREEALIDIYKVMRPGEPPTVETASYLFNSLFFDNSRYDLSAVGRVKMNARLDIDMDEAPEDMRVLTKDDILRTVKTLVNLKDGRGEVDDIDHLGNRRVRSVGELMENQYRMGLVRMERAVRERMSSVDIDTVMPNDLFNAKSIISVIREFFGSSQLSQFMDQNNPLSEITHKRRLSSLGPGGLTRERAGFEVRDVHLTHYGRICPIETPEGPNIGLINSLATYARVNQYGFIETPYRKVVNRKVTDEVVYLSALEEGKYVIAQANSEVNEKGELFGEQVSARKSGASTLVSPDEIDLMDVSPKQLVSAAAALIPFLENDDANRALMGSNMQRQAVPLMKTDAPFVGTGMEKYIAKDSGAAISAKRDGVVQQVDGNRIVIKATGTVSSSDSGVDIYNLAKFQRSNQSTCLNQKPLVKVGDNIKAQDIIADGAAIDKGELALGRNVLAAFMPWNGYNYEDSILISERIVKEDVFTSIHIEEFEVMARDTKLGQEEITRDIPNVGEENLKQLDEAGIVYIGAEVKAGDILVGKVTPKGETQMSPEEKLLRAIFGEKAADVRDTSLRVPPGVTGTIVDVRLFNRRGIEKDERSKSIEHAAIEKKIKDRDAEKFILETNYYERLEKLLLGQTVGSKKSASKSKKEANEGEKITAAYLSEIGKYNWSKIVVSDDEVMTELEEITKTFETALAQVQKRFEKKVEKIQAGDEMITGVLKAVKVFVAVKRKLQPGDKMAGRHGNKGVVSRVMPIEDMPYTEDGTPVDLVLNPLGVPSRMNIGQILETHLGWACKAVGKQVGEIVENMKVNKASENDLRNKLKDIYNKEEFAIVESMDSQELMELAGNLKGGITISTPVFDGAKEKDISDFLSMGGLDSSGQVTLYDGRTGEPFDRKVTIGYIYMLKLHHLVDEKIHARSVGPYSLVTQQPLGGKAQFGGQRFGEMEVWALQAYGAAYTLQEVLTVKSDDVAGRTRVYESIVRGDDNFEAGTPESFNVLMKEIRSLGLNIELTQKDAE